MAESRELAMEVKAALLEQQRVGLLVTPASKAMKKASALEGMEVQAVLSEQQRAELLVSPASKAMKQASALEDTLEKATSRRVPS